MIIKLEIEEVEKIIKKHIGTVFNLDEADLHDMDYYDDDNRLTYRNFEAVEIEIAKDTQK